MTEAANRGEGRQVFGFETDFAGTLHCIPMIVRFKLDQCGVKLHLRHWKAFSQEERERLITGQCRSAEEVDAYGEALRGLIEMRSGDIASSVAIEDDPQWAGTQSVPEDVKRLAVERGAPPPTREAWAALTPLQRFTLVKLTRPGHDNDNFIPAMQEFGLVPPDAHP